MLGIDLLGEQQSTKGFYGVTVGIVTNNQDPDELGRVKVKYPWLSEEIESHWARVLTPMAGNGYGMYFLPEIDTEVLLAFEQGDMNFPYILGALWNGKDIPPLNNDDGENNQRIIKSRSGNKIVLDDTEGEEKIVIEDELGKNKIELDFEKKTLTIAVEKDLKITTEDKEGKIELNSKGDIVIDCKSLSIKTEESYTLETGKACNVQSKGKYELKAQSALGIQCSAGVKINNDSLEIM